MKKVLIVVDYQYDFASKEGALSVEGGESIYENIDKLISDPSFDNVIYTLDTHTEDKYINSEEGSMFPPHCELNTTGWELYKIKPRHRAISNIINDVSMEVPTDFSVEEEFVFMKDKFSIWEGNKDYESFFQSKFDKDTEIVIVGLATNYCVFMNVMGCIERGYKNVSIMSDSIKGIKDDTYEQNINIMKNRGVVFK